MNHSTGLQIGRRFGSVPPIRGYVVSQAALIGLVLALVCAGRAHAGTMYVYSCHTPNGAPAGTSGWTHSAAPTRAYASDDCSTGPAGVLFAQVVGGDRAAPATWDMTWTFSAAAGTTITGFAAAVCPQINGGHVVVTWPGSPPRFDAVFRRFPDSSGIASTMYCHGVAPYWADARNSIQRQGLSTSQLALTASCGLCDFATLRGSLELSSFRADIRDDTAPVVSAVRGALAANFSHTGIEPVEFDVSDSGVGVYRATVETRILKSGPWLELGSTLVGRGRASCAERDVSAHPYEFDDPQPCPLRVSGAKLDFDTGRLSAGEHELRVVVEDASGNRADVIAPRAFVVAPPTGIAVPALVAPAAPLAAGRPIMLRIADAARRPLPSAEPFRVQGSLTDADGSPLGGVALTVRTRPFLPKPALSAGEWTVVGQVVTAPNGTFNARLPGGGSRTVQLMREAGDGLAATAAQIDVVVPAQLTAKAKATRIRNGRSAVITGRVAGPIPPGGVPVALEVREPGRWIPVATTRRWVKTTPSGRFKLAYRFRRTYAATTYRFRVVADEDSAFPYTRGVSRTIAVRVRP